MRSKGPTEHPGAAAFGALITELAMRAGYDLRPGGVGRAQLSEATGMSVSAVGRMLRGETLPKVANVYKLASVLRADEARLLDTAGYRSLQPREDGPPEPVLSIAQPLTPEGIADALGITNPFVRRMLISNIEEAVRLQREADQSSKDGGTGGRAAAR
jgi:transcriptional regulator with XRE-family HTH domain